MLQQQHIQHGMSSWQTAKFAQQHSTTTTSQMLCSWFQHSRLIKKKEKKEFRRWQLWTWPNSTLYWNHLDRCPQLTWKNYCLLLQSWWYIYLGKPCSIISEYIACILYIVSHMTVCTYYTLAVISTHLTKLVNGILAFGSQLEKPRREGIDISNRERPLIQLVLSIAVWLCSSFRGNLL